MNYRSLILLILCTLSVCVHAQELPQTDPVAEAQADSVAIFVPDEQLHGQEITLPAEEVEKNGDDDKWWWTLFKQGKLNLRDDEVRYPRFMRFCVDVYNWADTTFNSYDENYVRSTGRRWKAMLRNENFFDSYHIGTHLDDRRVRLDMVSDACVNVGAYIQYMAVSVGYSVDMGNILWHRPINLKKTEFSFTCARFTGDIYYMENTGGTYLRRLKTPEYLYDGKDFFPGVKSKLFNVDAYYFFNNRRYSQGAAYSYAKYQIRSAGSFMLGFAYSHQDITMDFRRLPDDILQQVEQPLEQDELKVKSNDYTLLLGYGYNWVFAKNFLYNITLIPGVGLNHNNRQSTVNGGINRLSYFLRGRMGITYNLHDFFCGLHGEVTGHWYRSSTSSFVNTVVVATISVGVRF